jgi:hypothetical protein
MCWKRKYVRGARMTKAKKGSEKRKYVRGARMTKAKKGSEEWYRENGAMSIDEFLELLEEGS